MGAVNFKAVKEVYYLDGSDKAVMEKFWHLYKVAKKQIADLGFTVRKEGGGKKTAAKKAADELASVEGVPAVVNADGGNWFIYYDTKADGSPDILGKKMEIIKTVYATYLQKTDAATTEMINSLKAASKDLGGGKPAGPTTVSF